MTRNPESGWWTDWWFSFMLMFAYVALSCWWALMNREAVIVSGVLAAVVLSAGIAMVQRRRYFLNRWDLLLHASVPLDIVLEAVLVREHSASGFSLCALGFAAVIGGYRLHLQRRALRCCDQDAVQN